MASVMAAGPGRYRIAFYLPGGERRIIRLKCDKRTAESTARHLEVLRSCAIARQPWPSDTAAWVADLAGPLRSKLELAGLLAPLPEHCTPTLGEYCTAYLARQTHVKPASRLATEQAIRTLLAYFGPDRKLDSITPGDAEDIRRWMLSEARAQRRAKADRPGLAPATVGKRLQRFSAIFNDARKRRLIAENPFQGLKIPPAVNRERQAYVPVEVVQRLIEATPDPERRLLLAMARYLGVRVPSEPFSLTWGHVLWDRQRLVIPSPKTSVHGKSYRTVPLVEPVRELLAEVYAAAPEGSEYVFHRLRQRASMRHAARGFWMAVNLRQWLLKLLQRLGMQPWPRLFHALRASCQTDWSRKLPLHVVCEWLGNTRQIAADHYLQVTDADFAVALRPGAIWGEKNPTPSSGGHEVARQVARAALSGSDLECYKPAGPGETNHSIPLLDQAEYSINPIGIAEQGFEP